IVKSFDRTPYYETLSKVGTESISEIEDELYRIYYSRILRISPENLALKLFIDFIKMEIDIKNVKTILRLKVDDVPSEDIIKRTIPGGYQIDFDEARKLAAMPMDELKKALEGYWLWKDIELNGELSKVENKLDALHIKAIAKKSNGYPLSILPVLHFMNLKKIEADNLRILGWGKWEGIPNESLEEQLVIV
ncbi:MAG TPA: V-type ATP synthase subunit C, partial [Archaeoglobaceae archaeon]|nr:V-type ATP synthase subunit C [Archaeoglobaceae archaeon]